MDKALAELIKISNVTGKDIRLVQGGGGNTSVKTADGKYMYIKASGTALKDMDKKNGWRRMDVETVRSIIDDKKLASLEEQKREVEIVNRLLTCCDDDLENGSRPSVEAHLHSFLADYVIHLHPVAVGAYVNTKDGKRKIEKLFKDEKLPPLWVPYADPGFMLARKISNLVDKYKKDFGKDPAILFLEKHGLFVSAKSANAALRLVRKTVAMCNDKLIEQKPGKLKKIDTEVVKKIKLAIRQAYFNTVGRYACVNFFVDEMILSYAKNVQSKSLLKAGVLNPDELVYANGPAVWIDDADNEKLGEQIEKQMRKTAKPAVSFLVAGVGLFVVGGEKSARTIADIVGGSLFIRKNAMRMGSIATLSRRQQEFINKWEAEAFRKKVSQGVSVGQIKDRVAMVTGAGSGIGKSIAIGLARAGAIVGLADIDTKAAQTTAGEITAELPNASTVVLACNVTCQESVNAAFDELVQKFGGLDILVNAAGVAPPFALVDLPVEKWRMALEVNLTGYFLTAKAAAKIMIAQKIGGSIVNISSKSGLEASKNNTPYNATKAGEIHMARGWAMELGPMGIRVNSVAPGNVFEGSKIWNPEYIKVCAKKYGIKPEEVIPYYVDKTALKREIKGQDIADSVVFLCSDQARTITGQVIVADSGQVMVRKN